MQNYWSVLPAFILWAVSMPLLFVAPQKAIMNSVAPQQLGQAGGIVISAQMLGGTIGMAVASVVFSTTKSYQAIFAVVALLVLAVFIYGWLAIRESSESVRQDAAT